MKQERKVVKSCKKHGDLDASQVYKSSCNQCLRDSSRKHDSLAIEHLSDSYIRKTFKRPREPIKNIPPELIEFKRIQILIKREARKQRRQALEAWAQTNHENALGRVINLQIDD